MTKLDQLIKNSACIGRILNMSARKRENDK